MSERRAMARVPWQTLSSRPIYRNPWISVRSDAEVVWASGRTKIFRLVDLR